MNIAIIDDVQQDLDALAEAAREHYDQRQISIQSPTTSSTGGLILALQRAILLLAPQGGVTSTFTGPL